MSWVYYVVIMNLSGVQEVNITTFDNIDKCEVYMRENHKRLKKQFSIDGEQRMTGSGCKRQR